MRMAYELAHLTGLSFCQGPIQFLAMDDVAFKRPVPVGAVLALVSQVIYTSNHTFQVKVNADVLNISKNTRERTNIFHFTFFSTMPEPIENVVPRSYAESVRFHRHFRHLIFPSFLTNSSHTHT